MKIYRLFVTALVVILSLASLRAEIEFVGATVENAETKLGLRDNENGTAKWLKPGEQFNGFTLVSYDEAKKSVCLSKEGAEIEITLKAAKIANEPVTPSVQPTDYIIKPGDTAAKIARAAGISLADLQALNPGVNWNKLGVGQKIWIKRGSRAGRGLAGKKQDCVAAG